MAGSTTEIPINFDYQASAEIYRAWESDECFKAEASSGKPPYTIVIPPPNVTGALHLGHALNNTLQDIQIRWHRMRGYEALWMPGTDHAGIATQAVVERRLKELENKTRHDLGRDALVQRIWNWKAEYETRILNQLRSMGCSCDWSRTRFTLDDVCAKAVRTTFYDLFSKGLIFRGKRLVNWDTYLQTAVSDDEVNYVVTKGHFWHFQYPVINPKDGEPTHVTIATTRPETMLGDTAVAVHPDPESQLKKVESQLQEKLSAAPAKEKDAVQKQIDDLDARRTSHLPLLQTLAEMAARGVKLRLPLLDREIPLVADVWAKPELGSGCVKITPAHDPNDYEVGLRCELPMINVMNEDGTLNSEAGSYAGLTMKKARTKVVEDLEELGLVLEIEERDIDLAHSDRSKTPIEPFLADQWFVKMEQLAQNAMDAVTDGRVKILPERYALGYLAWLGEKRDWPVGRQLWWGHQIPIWTKRFESPAEAQADLQRLNSLPAAKDKKLTCSLEGDVLLHACVLEEGHACEAELEKDGFIRQEDVLDTWFSSALWPHSTLGWPEQTEDLEYFYPTSALITSRDIITLWVARMVLMGLNNVGEVPFSEVYIHPKILDGQGETMSKSKGNGVDPIDVISKFGADALRFGLAWLATETQDVRMPVQYECPECQEAVNQTKKNRVATTVVCPHCNAIFSTQWAETEEDKSHPKASVTSERFEVARNFCNKLWNASRFAMLNLEGFKPVEVEESKLPLEDRWILSRLSSTIEKVTSAIAQHRYSDAARTVYDFAWDEFCSFYVEMAKPRLQSEETRAATQQVLLHTLDQLLRLLHPMTPFITEAIWQELSRFGMQRTLNGVAEEQKWLMKSSWPEHNNSHIDPHIEQQFETFVKALQTLREIRAAQNITPKTEVDFSLECDADTAKLLEPMRPFFKALAKANCTALGSSIPDVELSAKATVDAMEITVDLGEHIDLDAEIARNEKQLAGVAKATDSKKKKLENKSFVDRAPAEVVAKEREALEELESQASTIRDNITRLKVAKEKRA